ncbi:MAG: helix-turn-helix transcriptional regulator [Olsenella sp.]|nr:helix-turn-helix transcriptional regulator [Olsenella sp.]
MSRRSKTYELARGVVVSFGTFAPDGSVGFWALQRASLVVVALCEGLLGFASQGESLRLEGGAILLARPSAVSSLNAESHSGGFAVSVDAERVTPETLAACAALGVSREDVERILDEGEGVRVFPPHGELMSVLGRVCACERDQDVAGMRLRVIELMSCVVAEAEREAEGSKASASHQRIAARAVREMREDLACPKTIALLARKCDTSPTVLKESFREVYGMPVYSWYRRYRMEAASRRLLDGHSSVADVALSVGYSNPSKFAKAFGETMGMTPSEWRQVMAGSKS